jgi:hypothetical protein
MAIPSGSLITLQTTDMEWALSWTGFDLDDCFDLFQITVRESKYVREFAFGPCTVSHLRRTLRFFDSGLDADVTGGGFRNPDVRSFELHRNGPTFKLLIELPQASQKESFLLADPTIHIDRTFMNHYDGGDAADIRNL